MGLTCKNITEARSDVSSMKLQEKQELPEQLNAPAMNVTSELESTGCLMMSFANSLQLHHSEMKNLPDFSFLLQKIVTLINRCN